MSEMGGEPSLDRPVIILGAARSGTTLLGQMLGRHPAVAYWEEPKHIWRYGNAYRRHDVRVAADATPGVSSYIRAQFARFVSRSRKARFVDKTPGNCFRVPFILEVFPDAKLVHLIRDGRAVAVSAAGQWTRDFIAPPRGSDSAPVMNSSYKAAATQGGVLGGVGEALVATRKFLRDKRRLSGGAQVWLEAPAYVPDLIRVFRRKLSGPGRAFLWGPRFPGMSQIHQTYSLLETCALQWMFSVQSVRLHTRGLDPDRVMELRYEALIEDPTDALTRICEFAELPEWPERELVATEMVRPEEVDRWRTHISRERTARLEGWLSPLLEELGYAAGREVVCPS